MFHHFFIFGFDLLFLILNNWISKGRHDFLNFILPFLLLIASFLIEFILESDVLVLHLYVLHKKNGTYYLYLYASCLIFLWFSSFSFMSWLNLSFSFYFLSLNYSSSMLISSLIFSTRRWSSYSSLFFSIFFLLFYSFTCRSLIFFSTWSFWLYSSFLSFYLWS